jgi:Tfp pilus assembly protein PilO
MLLKSNRGVLLLVVALMGWFFVVKPQLAVFAERSLEARVIQEENRSYAQRVEDITFIRDRGSVIQNVLTAQYLAMPRHAQIPEVLVMIEALAASSGVTLGNATVGDAASNEVPVSISFTGSQENVTNLLDALHDNIRTVIVKDQTLLADKGGLVTVSLQLGLIYQGDR